MCHVHFDVGVRINKLDGVWWWKEKWNAIAKVAGTAIYLAPCGASALGMIRRITETRRAAVVGPQELT
jgi:hypothetical protein